MARLFVSHSGRDNAYALAFQNWLAANGWDRDDVFIDLHDIGAGERWRDTLRKANAACEAVILLASPDSMGSVECQKELELAEALGKEILLAIIRDLTTNDPLLARYRERQFVDLSVFPQDHIEALTWKGQEHRIGFNVEALSKIKARLDELGIAPNSFSWPPKGVAKPEPYPGLSAFEEEDAGIFFGRDADIMAALTEIRLVRRRRSPRLLVIDAASGAGKSSFLRAGLWPRLKRDPEFAPLALVRPAQGILSGPDGLGRRIAPFFERHGTPRAAGTISAALLQADEDKAAAALSDLLAEAIALATASRQAVSQQAKAPSPLIAIDQAEELFQAEDDAESRRFLAILARLLNAPPPSLDPYVLLTIRADSVQSLLNRAAALHLETPKAIYLAPLSQAAYREVILKPAEIYTQRVKRLSVEPALAERLVADASGADALPLLAFTLAQLFADFGADGNLTRERYEALGGVNGSIRRALRQAQSRAGAAGTDAHLRRLLLPRLATWDPEADGNKGAAKRLVARYEDVAAGERANLAVLAEALVKVRLLTRGRDTIEVAHEALLRQPPIAGWLHEDRDFLIWRDRNGKARAAYEANTRGLLAGRELQIARDWLDTRQDADDIAAADRAFVMDSIADDERRRSEEEERERQRQADALALAEAREKAAREMAEAAKRSEDAAKSVAAAARKTTRRTALGLVAAGGAAVVAGAFYVRSAAQTKVAEGLRIASEAQTQRALLREAELLTGLADQELGKQNAVEAALIALEALPDATSTNAITRIRPLWRKAEESLNEALGSDLLRTFTGHADSVRSVTFSPDGRFALSGSGDNTLKLWDVSTGREVLAFTGHTDWVNSVTFSPDGRFALSGSYDKTLKLWDVSTGREVRAFTGHTSDVYSVTFSPDGRFALSGSYDKTLKLWDVSTGREVRAFTGHTSVVTSVTFSPDGRFALSGSYDDTLKLWDVSTGREVRAFTGHANWVTSVTFSPDGRFALSGSSDNTLKLWDVSTGRAVRAFTGHSDSVLSVAFSPDGRYFVSGAGAPEKSTPDGKRAEIKLWVASTGTLLHTFVAGSADVNSVAFSPDGRLVLSGSGDKTLKLWALRPAWELATGQTLVDRAKERVPRCLTPAQRKQYFLPPEVPDWCYAMKKWPYQNGRDAPPDITPKADDAPETAK